MPPAVPAGHETTDRRWSNQVLELCGTKGILEVSHAPEKTSFAVLEMPNGLGAWTSAISMGDHERETTKWGESYDASSSAAIPIALSVRVNESSKSLGRVSVTWPRGESRRCPVIGPEDDAQATSFFHAPASPHSPQGRLSPASVSPHGTQQPTSADRQWMRCTLANYAD